MAYAAPIESGKLAKIFMRHRDFFCAQSGGRVACLLIWVAEGVCGLVGGACGDALLRGIWYGVNARRNTHVSARFWRKMF